MKVCKFGGTSLADAGQVAKVCQIVLADPDRRVVVVSAPGKRHAKDVKVTDLLIAAATEALKNGDGMPILRQVVARYEEIRQAMDLEPDLTREIEADLVARLHSDRSHPDRFMDLLKAAGEDNSARLVAAAFRKLGVPARYVNPRDAGLLLSDEYGKARILPESYERLASLRQGPELKIFPGFFGFTRQGHVVTFSRGGSDITGSILAAAVRAEVYENFTDVDSVFAADPRIVESPAPIQELSYREMRELSYAGFGVLHDEAVIPAVQAGIPICIRNTNRPEAPGTTIVPKHTQSTPRVVGIASGRGFCTVFVSKYLMNREIGFGRRLLQILEEERVSYEHMPSGIDDLSIVLEEKYLAGGVEERLVSRIREDLGAEDVEVERGLALVMIVGEGMRYAVGFAAQATQALADAGVNIEMMNQGSSEISMMFGVKAEDQQRAVRSLYQAFFGSRAAAGKTGAS